MLLDTVHVLYICNEINLALMYKEVFTKEDYRERDSDLVESFSDIIDNLHVENLSLIDEQISLSHKNSNFEHIHKIEDDSKTLFKLLYLVDINAFFSKIKRYRNLAYYEEYNSFRFTRKRLSRTTKVKENIDIYCKNVDYQKIKEIMIKDNKFEFFPFISWIESKNVNENNITKIKFYEEHTINILKIPMPCIEGDEDNF